MITERGWCAAFVAVCVAVLAATPFTAAWNEAAAFVWGLGAILGLVRGGFELSSTSEPLTRTRTERLLREERRDLDAARRLEELRADRARFERRRMQRLNREIAMLEDGDA